MTVPQGKTAIQQHIQELIGLSRVDGFYCHLGAASAAVNGICNAVGDLHAKQGGTCAGKTINLAEFSQEKDCPGFLTDRWRIQVRS